MELISVYQLFSIVPALMCEITVITVKTFEKTRMKSHEFSSNTLSLMSNIQTFFDTFNGFYDICNRLHDSTLRDNKYKN